MPDAVGGFDYLHDIEVRGVSTVSAIAVQADTLLLRWWGADVARPLWGFWRDVALTPKGSVDHPVRDFLDRGKV